MKTWHKVFLFGTVAIGTIGILAYRKTKKLMEVFDKITFSVAGLSNFDISLQRIRFNVKIKLTNNSITDFVISSLGAVKLQRIVALDKEGKVIGTATIPYITEIKVGGYESVVLPEVTFNLPLSDALKIISTQALSNFTPDAILNIMDFAIVFDIAGKKIEYTTR